MKNKNFNYIGYKKGYRKIDYIKRSLEDNEDCNKGADLGIIVVNEKALAKYNILNPKLNPYNEYTRLYFEIWAGLHHPGICVNVYKYTDDTCETVKSLKIEDVFSDSEIRDIHKLIKDARKILKRDERFLI